MSVSLRSHSKTFSASPVASLICNTVSVVAGDTVIIKICASAASGTTSFSTPTDDQMNSYSVLNSAISLSGNAKEKTVSYVATATSTGTLTITVAANQTAYLAGFIAVFVGGFTVNAVNSNATSPVSVLGSGNAAAITGDLIYSSVTSWGGTTSFTDDSGGTIIDQSVNANAEWMVLANGWRESGTTGNVAEQWTITSADYMTVQIATLTPVASTGPSGITSPTVATTGIKATGTLDPNGASISATDYTKVILGGQATACSSITALTVGNSTSSGVAYTITLSGLVVPGISFTADFSDGAFTNTGGVNADTGVLAGTNNSTTIDLIVDSGTLSGTTATINFNAVYATSLIDHATLYVNNSSVGNFTTGGVASPVVGGDLIIINGYLADDTLIASGTLFTVSGIARIGANIVAAMSGVMTMTPPANGFADSTWRDTTSAVNSTAFVSQSGSSGTWSVSSGFTVGHAWGFSAVPTYVMNQTGTITGGNLTAGSLTLLSQGVTSADFRFGSANGDGVISMTFQSSTSNGVAWIDEITLPNQDFSGTTYTTGAPPVASTWLYREEFSSAFGIEYSNTITLEGVYPILAGTVSHVTSGLLLGMV